MTEPAQRYEIRFQLAARRAIAERLPETVATAVLEFCDSAFAVNPARFGKPTVFPSSPTGRHNNFPRKPEVNGVVGTVLASNRYR